VSFRTLKNSAHPREGGDPGVFEVSERDVCGPEETPTTTHQKSLGPRLRGDERKEGYEFCQSPCGGVHVHVAGRLRLLRHSGCLWLEDASALVFADVHLEKGSAFAARGQLLPPYDTRETLRRMALEIEALNPRMIVMLGDAFHDGGAEARMDHSDIRTLFAIAAGRTLVWVVGNHDPKPPENLPGEPADELSLSGLLLRHEPEPGAPEGETAGHLHPCARVVAGGRSVRRRCFVTDGRRLILPAFGAYAGGLSIRDVAFAGLFARAPLAVALGERRAHAVGWGSVRPD
jgi:DNA ligase-associated metallophosphoesterase